MNLFNQDQNEDIRYGYSKANPIKVGGNLAGRIQTTIRRIAENFPKPASQFLEA